MQLPASNQSSVRALFIGRRTSNTRLRFAENIALVVSLEDVLNQMRQSRRGITIFISAYNSRYREINHRTEINYPEIAQHEHHIARYLHCPYQTCYARQNCTRVKKLQYPITETKPFAQYRNKTNENKLSMKVCAICFPYAV